jgi:ribosomal protein S18 acetylase RimI-like enzyme
MGEVVYRRATAEDDAATFALFRRSITDYLRRTGLVGPDEKLGSPEQAWPRWERMYTHLREHAAEHWVAEDDAGRLLGYARSVETDGLFELSELFVEPGLQARGVGRGLLERAFPLGRGRRRTIIATQDARAVALYLRFGVDVQSVGVDFAKAPEPAHVETDLEIVEAAPDECTLRAILDVEEHVLGHRREADVRLLLEDRPAVLYVREGRVVGYGFDPNAHEYFGPVAMLDPADVPAALAHLETKAHEAGMEWLSPSVPLVNTAAVGWLLGRGFHIDPFYVLYLSDPPLPGLDRYLPTVPVVIL